MSEAGAVLVVDDEKNIRRTVALVLESEGFTVLEAERGEDTLPLLAETPADVVLLDVCLPGVDGLTVLREVLAHDATLPVIMISGHASFRDAIEATRLGAFDFLEKPLSRERLLLTVRNAARARRDAQELVALRAAGVRRAGDPLLGAAPVMAALRQQIAKVAPTRGRVLITGESGTGKELIARAIHEASDRRARPFIKVNCAAIPDDLIESTLFGHEKGAFTSAVARRRGQFELADGGTLFLDEVGDMSLAAQAKVLRVVQTGELTRVGGESPVTVDVRLVAATNQDLAVSVREGRFREDLFFRLNVVPLRSPPLRVRREDIPGLAAHFLAQVCAENEFRPKRMTPAVLESLVRHDWPGNVRELRNVVERLAILSGETIDVGDLPPDFGPAGIAGPAAAWGALFAEGTLADIRETVERELLESRLRAFGWNISRAADSLGVERTNLHKKLKALGIERAD